MTDRTHPCHHRENAWCSGFGQVSYITIFTKHYSHNVPLMRSHISEQSVFTVYGSTTSKRTPLHTNGLESVKLTYWKGLHLVQLFCTHHISIWSLILFRYMLWPCTPRQPQTAVACSLLKQMASLQLESGVSLKAICQALNFPQTVRHTSTYDSFMSSLTCKPNN